MILDIAVAVSMFVSILATLMMAGAFIYTSSHRYRKPQCCKVDRAHSVHHHREGRVFVH